MENEKTLISEKQAAKILGYNLKYFKEQMRNSELRKYLKPKAKAIGDNIVFDIDDVRTFKEKYRKDNILGGENEF